MTDELITSKQGEQKPPNSDETIENEAINELINHIAIILTYEYIRLVDINNQNKRSKP
jgi:hypothetical protein